MEYDNKPLYYLPLGHIPNNIELSYACTKDQLADIFTKPLDEARFCYLRNELNIIDSRSLAWPSCILTYIWCSIWFRCRHGYRGSVVLIDWANPPPIMPIVKTSCSTSFCWFMGLNDEHWLWTQDISSRCHAIRSYMVASATDLFLKKSWLLLDFICIFFWAILVLWETHSNLGKFTFFWSFCKLSENYHNQFEHLNLSQTILI